jgi:hypothetical protein
MIGNIFSKHQKELLKFGKDQVVCLETESSNSSKHESSSDEEYREIKSAMTYSILKGIQFEPE